MSVTAAPGLTGGTLDRADHLRHDADALAAAMGDWRARLLKLDGLHPEVSDDGVLGWTTLADAPDDALLILLGLDESGRPHFAAYLPGTRAAEATPMRSPAMFHALATLQPGVAATYAATRIVIDWHSRHQFCANCGTMTDPFRAGWARKCPNCGTEHFPRVDPVVIMIAEQRAAAARAGRRGAIRRWPVSSNRASRSRKRSRAKFAKRPACASARCATSPASPGPFPHR